MTWEAYASCACCSHVSGTVIVHVCIYLCSDLNLAGGGSSSSTALVATGPISLDSSSSEEYSPGFITGDEIVTEQGIDSNIASIFLACILCLCYV